MGYGRFALSFRGIDSIETWVIHNEDGGEVFRAENFALGTLEPSWDGLYNNQLQEGRYLSHATFMSPTGIENFVEFSFCAVPCNKDVIDEYIDDGLDLTNSLWWSQSNLPPYENISELYIVAFNCD